MRKSLLVSLASIAMVFSLVSMSLSARCHEHDCAFYETEYYVPNRFDPYKVKMLMREIMEQIRLSSEQAAAQLSHERYLSYVAGEIVHLPYSDSFCPPKRSCSNFTTIQTSVTTFDPNKCFASTVTTYVCCADCGRNWVSGVGTIGPEHSWAFLPHMDDFAYVCIDCNAKKIIGRMSYEIP